MAEPDKRQIGDGSDNYTRGEHMSKLKKIVLGLGGIALTVVGLSVLSNGGPVKFSPAWIEGLTDAEWASEREVLRQQYTNPKYDDATRNEARRLMDMFDRVLSSKRNSVTGNCGPGYHREHGYNLYKPD